VAPLDLIYPDWPGTPARLLAWLSPIDASARTTSGIISRDHWSLRQVVPSGSASFGFKWLTLLAIRPSFVTEPDTYRCVPGKRPDAAAAID